MAAHKLNTLHWHLADDQGWRIEIKQLSAADQVGALARARRRARRRRTLPRDWRLLHPGRDPRDRRLCRASAAITIVPEIEMPGHALAAIRAYPELGTGVDAAAGIEIRLGRVSLALQCRRRHLHLPRECADEVMALFPSHLYPCRRRRGGEGPVEGVAAIQARMRALGIADEKALQSWFIAADRRFLSSTGPQADRLGRDIGGRHRAAMRR